MKERDAIQLVIDADEPGPRRRNAIEQRRKELRKLAAWDFQERTWVDLECINGMHRAYRVGSHESSGWCDTKLEAIESLRAKLEGAEGSLDDALEEGRKELASGAKRKTYGSARELLDAVAQPDKRVPARMLSDTAALLRDNYGLRAWADALEACPDIEPATLDPTAQAVLDELSEWTITFGEQLCPREHADTYGEGMREAKSVVSKILRKVHAAGRPTVVGAGEGLADTNETLEQLSKDHHELQSAYAELLQEKSEDADLLAALKECRELGIPAGQTDTGLFWVGKWVVGIPLYEHLPEALAAYKAAQRPAVKDGWYWAVLKDELAAGYCPVKFVNGRSVDYLRGPYRHNAGAEQYDILRDRLPDLPPEAAPPVPSEGEG